MVFNDTGDISDTFFEEQVNSCSRVSVVMRAAGAHQNTFYPPPYSRDMTAAARG
jgi:hypothetical protein